MDLELWKKIKKEKKLTLFDIAKIANIPKRTVDDVFSGKTKTPRIDTVQAIEKALGIDKAIDVEVSAKEKEFFELFRQLTEEEKKEFYKIAEFILSKRQ